MIKKYKYYIGIDTGANTGFAVWFRDKKELMCVDAIKIHIAMDRVFILNKANPGLIFVRVEDARLRKWIPRQKDAKTESGRREGAGSVKRDASIWEDFLKDLGIDYEMVAPKDNKTKVDAVYFKRLTGYQGSTNGHGRDAGMLVFGM